MAIFNISHISAPAIQNIVALIFLFNWIAEFTEKFLSAIYTEYFNPFQWRQLAVFAAKCGRVNSNNATSTWLFLITNPYYSRTANVAVFCCRSPMVCILFRSLTSRMPDTFSSILNCFWRWLDTWTWSRWGLSKENSATVLAIFSAVRFCWLWSGLICFLSAVMPPSRTSLRRR